MTDPPSGPQQSVAEPTQEAIPRDPTHEAVPREAVPRAPALPDPPAPERGPALPLLRETPWVPWALAAAGLVVLAAGVVVVVREGDATGALSLVIAGPLLMLLPLVVDRLTKLSVSGKGVELELTRQIAELGAPQAAGILERSGLATFAAAYAFVHEELAGDAFEPAKVRLQDRLVEKAAEVAKREKFDAGEVRRLFASGAPMVRVLVLGLMQGDTSLADPATIFSAVAHSRTGNEQFQGMKLATLAWRNLSPAERQTVATLVEADPYVAANGDRRALAAQIQRMPVA